MSSTRSVAMAWSASLPIGKAIPCRGPPVARVLIDVGLKSGLVRWDIATGPYGPSFRRSGWWRPFLAPPMPTSTTPTGSRGRRTPVFRDPPLLDDACPSSDPRGCAGRFGLGPGRGRPATAPMDRDHPHVVAGQAGVRVLRQATPAGPRDPVPVRGLDRQAVSGDAACPGDVVGGLVTPGKLDAALGLPPRLALRVAGRPAPGSLSHAGRVPQVGHPRSDILMPVC
jgi:hypothetical protein